MPAVVIITGPGAESPNNHLGQLIRSKRGPEPLRSFAAKMGITLAHLSDIERGRRHVPIRQLPALAEGLGLPLDKVVAYSICDRYGPPLARFCKFAEFPLPDTASDDTVSP